MAALPYIQLYVADYLADTSHLNVKQHGIYLLLIMHYWQTGKPIDQNKIPFVLSAMDDRDEILNILDEFFDKTDDGLWCHRRIEKDLGGVRLKSKKASSAGVASGKARREKINGRSTDVQRMLDYPDIDTEKKEGNDAGGACLKSKKASSSEIAPGKSMRKKANNSYTSNGRSTDVQRTLNHTDTDTDTDKEKEKEKEKEMPPSAPLKNLSFRYEKPIPIPDELSRLFGRTPPYDFFEYANKKPYLWNNEKSKIQFEKFIDFYREKNHLKKYHHKDWLATWRSWVRQEYKWRKDKEEKESNWEHIYNKQCGEEFMREMRDWEKNKPDPNNCPEFEKFKRNNAELKRKYLKKTRS